MASLMENIITILNAENDAYTELIVLSREKTPVIVKGDLNRMSVMKDIADVTNRSDEELKLTDLIELMGNRPEEQRKLREVHDRLKTTLDEMRTINDRNRELLKSSLDMVEFEINLLQSMKQAPETADYNKNAYSTGTIMGSGTKRFDTKQ